jgi:hypothetical protein
MRRLYVLFIALCMAASPALAQQDPIRKTIQSQLDAIAQDDYNLAFSFASSVIKEVFGDAATFEKMVRKGYPMVADHRSVTMLELRTVAGNLWQRVMITDTLGDTHLLDYMMVETSDGWRINAVQLLPKQGVGA